MFIISFSMFFDVSRFAPGHAIRTCYSPQPAQVGEDFSHNLLAPSSSLPPSHMGVIMCQPGRKPFWNSTERDLAARSASEDEEWWRFSKTNGYSCGFLADGVSNLRTPSEEILVAGVVLSNTCIDQRLQGHLFSLPPLVSTSRSLRRSRQVIKASDQGIRFEVACVDQAVPGLFSPHTHIRKQ